MKPNELPNMVFNAKRNLLTRRSALQLGAAAALSGSLAGYHLARAGQRIPYGVAVNMEPFRNDPEFKELLIRYVDVIVPMNALKWHDLRHSTASYLAMNGATLAEIAEVLGHKTLAMVKRYAHLSEDHTADVVERMNARIFGEG